MSELALLNGAVKKLGALVASVEVVQQYGLDSDEFKHIHDVVITNLQLEPQETFPRTFCLLATG